MIEIGNIFKEKREEIGITIEEVAADLEVDPILIDNLEEGNDKVFKDVLEVKKIISAYSKYLDIEKYDLLEEYNDYLFEKTSKINQADIRERLKKEEQIEKAKEEMKIKSPYTKEIKETKMGDGLILVIVLILILIVLYFVLKQLILG